MPRRRKINPFLLVIVDSDNKTFSIEGPMTDDTAWISAVVRVRKSGRTVNCYFGGSDRHAIISDYGRGNKEVPSGTIVHKN